MASHLSCFADGASWRVDAYGVIRFVGDRTWVGRAKDGLPIDFIMAQRDAEEAVEVVLVSVEDKPVLETSKPGKGPACLRVSLPRKVRGKKHIGHRRGYV